MPDPIPSPLVDVRPAEGALGDADDRDERDRITRWFGSRAFCKLWLAQVVSATGDWLGLLAITALAANIGGGNAGTSIGLVLAARLIPGFFLATLAGVLVDRWNRRRVMVVCDLGRAAVLVSLPFVDSLLGLVIASLLLEGFTMLWSPAKEATVPNIVPREYLTTANSLSLAAAYGTFPLGAALFAGLAKVAEWLSDRGWVDTLKLNQEGLAFYVDALTFLVTALLILWAHLPARSVEGSGRRSEGLGLSQTWRDLREGWEFIFINPIVRSVNVGLATGLIGGGMLVPLGSIFAEDVLGAGDAGYGVFVTCLGLGVALGVIGLSLLQRRLPKDRVFAGAVLTAGVALIFAASMSTLTPAAILVTVIGVCAGTVYVLGFTLLHENVDDALRGRIFSALFTIVRMCVLIAFLIGPVLAQVLDGLSNELWDRDVTLLGVDIAVPGVRLTLWLAGAIIVGAGALAGWSLRAGAKRAATAGGPAG